MTIGGLWARDIPTVFWQIERYFSAFSTGTEKEDFAGFSGMGWDAKNGNNAQFGLILPCLFHDDYVHI